MKKINNKNKLLVFGFWFLAGILLTVFVLASRPTWDGYGNYSYFNEEDSFSYNFSANVTDAEGGPLVFYFSQETPIIWSENSSASKDFFYWIFWNDTLDKSNSTAGVLIFNVTQDNETGMFNISMDVHDNESLGAGASPFYFIVNATNDAPEFTNLNNTYNLSQGVVFEKYINATDEEEHYPLFFNISFINNCTHAGWSGRNNNENCSLFDFGFNLTQDSDSFALMNFTPSENDVGCYWANISVMDFGENFSCPHNYCDNLTYGQNKTNWEIVKFNVFFNLSVDVSNCTNQIVNENENFVCYINVTTKWEEDELNISSLAFLRNNTPSYDVEDESWFYADNSTTSSDFIKTLKINFTPQKTEVGNWTINFSVWDLTSVEENITQIQIFVNRSDSLNVAPVVEDINDVTTSVKLDTIIYLNVSDDDLTIPDKQNGYNETTNFTVEIFNQSNLSQSLSLNGFVIDILGMPSVEGGKLTNKTTAKIQFTPWQNESGNYTINITAKDKQNFSDYKTFNLTIIPNEFPVWNQTSYSFDLIVNTSFITTQSFYLNLTDGYVSDSDNDSLIFTNSSSAFPFFNLTSDGIINFTPRKQDVGNWTFDVIVNDGYLSNTTSFTFNIGNINNVPEMGSFTVNSTSIDEGSNIPLDEDNLYYFVLYLNDEDYLIDGSKGSGYYESLTTNLLVLNSTGDEVNLFNFISGPRTGATAVYDAWFTPNSSQVGTYSVILNATDQSGETSSSLSFSLTIADFNDVPIIDFIQNYTKTINDIFYLDVNATDEEDGNESSGNLTFSIANLTVGGNFLTINSSTGVINISLNESYAGFWEFNISVNDTNNGINSSTGSQVFSLTVYGYSNITFPSGGEIFNLVENQTYDFTFRANHSVGDNLTYLFYIDNIVYNDSVNWTYSNLSLSENKSYYGNNTNLTWSFVPDFSDETYGKLKNLTLIVYPLNYSELNDSINLKLNVSHTNYPLNFNGTIPDQQRNYDQQVIINLSEYFSDADHEDKYYDENVTFTISSNSSPTNIVGEISSGWILALFPQVKGVCLEILNITAVDYNSSNQSMSNATSNNFEVEFTEPTTTVPPPPTSSRTKKVIEYYSLKIIIPGDIIIYEEKHIKVPLTIQNTGKVDLSEINLASSVSFNNFWTDDVTVSLAQTYIEELLVGEAVNLTMDINAEKIKTGRYRAKIVANVSSPKFSDWGEFFIELKKLNETEIEEKIIFTEKFIAENPECIELTELVKEARELFERGELAVAVKKSEEAINACRESIASNENFRPWKNKLEPVFYYLVFLTLFVFVLGFIIYIYKRVKFNKERNGDYI